MHVEQLKLRLRQLEDISALTHSGDTVLGRELFRTMHELNPSSSSISGGGLASTLSPGRQAWGTTTVSPAHRHWPRMTSTSRSTPSLSSHTQPVDSIHRTFSNTPEPSHRKPSKLAPLDVRGVVTPEPLRNNGGNHDAVPVHSGGTPDVDDDRTAMVRTSMDASPLSRGAQQRESTESTARRTCYPESLLIRLSTVHNVDPRVRGSIGDLDDAIAKAKENVRQLHREVRRRQVQFENLEPGEGYLLRNRKTLEEVIQSEEEALGNERALCQQKIVSAMSERTLVQQHIVELQEKLVLLKQHVESVHAAVAVERRMERETFPSLSDEDLFGAATSIDMHRRIETKRHAIKEAKQYLYKLRIKHAHSLTSAHRQVEKKQKELNALRSDAILFGSVVVPPSNSNAPPDDDGPFGRSPPPPPALLEDAVSDAPVKAAAAQEEKEGGRRKQSVRDTPPTSLELLNAIGLKRHQHTSMPGVGGKKAPPPMWAKQLPTDRKLRLTAIATLERMCLESEATERDQVHVIFTESLEVLASRAQLDRLAIEERRCAALSAERHRSPHRSVQRTKPKQASPVQTERGEPANEGDDASGGTSSPERPERTEVLVTEKVPLDWPELVPPHCQPGMPSDEGDNAETTIERDDGPVDQRPASSDHSDPPSEQVEEEAAAEGVDMMEDNVEGEASEVQDEGSEDEHGADEESEDAAEEESEEVQGSDEALNDRCSDAGGSAVAADPANDSRAASSNGGRGSGNNRSAESVKSSAEDGPHDGGDHVAAEPVPDVQSPSSADSASRSSLSSRRARSSVEVEVAHNASSSDHNADVGLTAVDADTNEASALAGETGAEMDRNGPGEGVSEMDRNGPEEGVSEMDRNGPEEGVSEMDRNGPEEGVSVAPTVAEVE